jgi:hypothetical protein
METSRSLLLAVILLLPALATGRPMPLDPRTSSHGTERRAGTVGVPPAGHIILTAEAPPAPSGTAPHYAFSCGWLLLLLVALLSVLAFLYRGFPCVRGRDAAGSYGGGPFGGGPGGFGGAVGGDFARFPGWTGPFDAGVVRRPRWTSALWRRRRRERRGTP